MIISRDLLALLETSIGISDFFIKFFSKTQKFVPILTILVGCGWLTNLSLLFRLR